MQKLNLYFGMNGMGKSSVIQSLLLLRQSFWENHKAGLDYLYTNGDLIRLGTGKDIFCQSATDDKIRFYVQFDNGLKYDCNYIYMFDDFDSDQLERMEKEPAEEYTTALFTEKFFYLSAEHLGLQKQYSVENWKKNGVAKLGTAGEFTVPFLAMEGDKVKVSDKMCHPKGKTNHLIDQVSAWMSEISPAARRFVHTRICDAPILFPYICYYPKGFWCFSAILIFRFLPPDAISLYIPRSVYTSYSFPYYNALPVPR